MLFVYLMAWVWICGGYSIGWGVIGDNVIRGGVDFGIFLPLWCLVDGWLLRCRRPNHHKPSTKYFANILLKRSYEADLFHSSDLLRNSSSRAKTKVERTDSPIVLPSWHRCSSPRQRCQLRAPRYIPEGCCDELLPGGWLVLMGCCGGRLIVVEVSISSQQLFVSELVVLKMHFGQKKC